jgi:phage terminase small subunit
MSSPKKKRLSKHKTDKPPMSLREIRFCQFYHDHGNGVQAYVDAGFTNATRHAAEVAAFALLRKPEIREYIRELARISIAAAKVTTEEIAAGIANIARADRRKLLTVKGTILAPNMWPDDVAACVESVEVGDTGGLKPKVYLKKVKTGNQLSAWKVLADWKKMTGGDKQPESKGNADQLVIEGEL